MSKAASRIKSRDGLLLCNIVKASVAAVMSEKDADREFRKDLIKTANE